MQEAMASISKKCAASASTFYASERPSFGDTNKDFTHQEKSGAVKIEQGAQRMFPGDDDDDDNAPLIPARSVPINQGNVMAPAAHKLHHDAMTERVQGQDVKDEKDDDDDDDEMPLRRRRFNSRLGRQPVSRPTASVFLKPKRQRALPEKGSDRPTASPSPSSAPVSSRLTSFSSSSSSCSSSSNSLSDDDNSSTSNESSDSERHVRIGDKRIPVRRVARAQAKAVRKSVGAAKRTKVSSASRSSSCTVRRSRAPSRKNEEASEDGDAARDDEDRGDEDDDEDEGTAAVGGRSVVSLRTVQRDAKQHLIAQILSRWWYVLDPWPPEDFDFDAALRRRRYKVVPLEEWELADDVDAEGFTKVYPISHYKGLYRDPQGNAIDVRPLEGKPCYSTFKNQSESQLLTVLVGALRNQLQAVETSCYRNTEEAAILRLKSSLQSELQRAEESLAQAERKKRIIPL